MRCLYVTIRHCSQNDSMLAQQQSPFSLTGAPPGARVRGHDMKFRWANAILLVLLLAAMASGLLGLVTGSEELARM